MIMLYSHTLQCCCCSHAGFQWKIKTKTNTVPAEDTNKRRLANLSDFSQENVSWSTSKIKNNRQKISLQRWRCSHAGVYPSSCRGHTQSHLISSHLSRSLADRWGTTVDFTTSFLHSSWFSAFRSMIFNSRPVHALMLSSHRFLCLPLHLPL